MQSWGPDREVEKPKPIKVRAGAVVIDLLNLRAALKVTGHEYSALNAAIELLQIVAGEKKAK